MQQELSHRSDNVKNRLMMRPPWVTETIEMQSDPHSPAFLPTLRHLSGLSILYLQQLHFSLNNYAHQTPSCGQKANFQQDNCPKPLPMTLRLAGNDKRDAVCSSCKAT